MTFVLILHFLGPAGTSVFVAGQMVDQPTCVMAGAGMAAILEQANAGLTVRVECRAAGVAA